MAGTGTAGTGTAGTAAARAGCAGRARDRAAAPAGEERGQGGAGAAGHRVSTFDGVGSCGRQGLRGRGGRGQGGEERRRHLGRAAEHPGGVRRPVGEPAGQARRHDARDEQDGPPRRRGGDHVGQGSVARRGDPGVAWCGGRIGGQRAGQRQRGAGATVAAHAGPADAEGGQPPQRPVGHGGLACDDGRRGHAEQAQRGSGLGGHAARRHEEDGTVGGGGGRAGGGGVGRPGRAGGGQDHPGRQG